MKAKFFVGLISIFFLFSVSIAEDKILSLNAVFDKPEYRVGQPVKLTVNVTNKSSEGVYVRLASTSVKVEAGGDSLFKQKGMPGSRGESKELKPGDTWPYELEYSSESFIMPPPGSYQVTVTYMNDKEEGGRGSGPGKKGTIKHDLWTGEIKTTAALKIID